MDAVLRLLAVVAELLRLALRRARAERAQAGADRIAADPGAEWLRRFKRSGPAAETDAGKPGRDG